MSAAPDAARHQRLRALFESALGVDAASRRAFLATACPDDAGLAAHAGRLLVIHETGAGRAADLRLTPASDRDRLGAERPVTPQRLLREVFDELLAIEPSQRPHHLHRLCDGDAALQSDVERLLAALDDAGSFLEHPVDWLAAGRDDPFPGTDRFRVIRRLGAGGMGVVYEVHDESRANVVALKTLQRRGAADLYRLKQEFRRLADVTHPNLVCLYELFVDGQTCFFTMELVRGTTFLEFVRRADGGGVSRERLESTLPQLIAGVTALHQRGILHRDIKPSNVLVTPEGRVVILDFGLSAEVFSEHSAAPLVGGTPAYMSPEEAAGGPPTEASDWYGVGVTLYQCLTGRLPFDGPVTEVLQQKREVDPAPPALVSSDPVAAELSDLCLGLLCRTPEQRLDSRAVLAALSRDGTAEASARSVRVGDAPFVGRRAQLDALAEAWADVGRGRATTVCIVGPSGIGKSALVRAFLNQRAPGAECVVLAGRCYENESVPYKALDGAIDDLSRWLAATDVDLQEALIPADVTALARVFPVLRQVPAVARRTDPQASDTDPLRLRRNAFTALGDLLRRLAARRPLLLWIDDLQWTDADSTTLIEDLLNAPDAPAMLTLFSFRSEEVGANSFLRALVERADGDRWGLVPLEPLAADDAAALVTELVPPEAPLSEHDRRVIVGESHGSPFVLEHLARYAGLGGSRGGPTPTVTAMLDARLRSLPAEASRFLETLVICGRPVEPEVVCDACAIPGDRQSLVAVLRASRLIRFSGSNERVEPYHDRIREALSAGVGADDMRDIHRRMAASLVARRSDDCEALFEHYRGYGDADNASLQAGLAAGKAGATLAFDRAASFYGFALELAPSSANVSAWKEALATALANAGRPAAAAEAYLRAADDAEHGRRVELQRLAAEQFLTGGHIDRGLDLLRTILRLVGLTYPGSPRAATVRVVWRRLRLGWRGLGFTARNADEIDRGVLLRLDTAWAAAAPLGLVDTVAALDFIAAHLHMALDAGDAARISRGLALESAARSSDRTFRSGATRLAAHASTLADAQGTPHAAAMCLLADGIAASACGEWLRARLSSERALSMLRDDCVGMTWETNIAQNIFIWALMYLGEIGEVCRIVPALLAEARRRGNRYLATELCTRCNYVWLAADAPDEGEREAVQAVAGWSSSGFHRQHYSAMLAQVQTALYRDDGERAWQLLADHQHGLRRSMLLHVQALRIETRYLRARSALAIAAATPSRRRRFLSIARADASRIARERMPWSDPIAGLVSAGIASVEGRTGVAVRQLGEAADRFERADMKLYLAVARRRLARLRDDASGRELGQLGDDWMRRQDIKNPTALTRMLAPGFPD